MALSDQRTLSPIVLASIVACATACGLDAAYQAFTTSTTGEQGTSEASGSSSGSTSGGQGGTDMSSSEGSAGMSGSSGGNEDSTGTGGESTGTTEAPPPFCGDGVRNEGEECDPLDPEAGKSCNEQCFRDRVAFVTSTRFVGDKLMGLVKGDLACNELAQAAGLFDAGGVAQMRAWLSGPDYDAGTRILLGEGRYVRPDGVVVVERGADLLSGHLSAPIAVDEWGEPVEEYAWTNTRADGTAISKVDTCNNWSYNGEYLFSYVGRNLSTDLNWTYVQSPLNPASCDIEFSLYCFEERGASP